MGKTTLNTMILTAILLAWNLCLASDPICSPVQGDKSQCRLPQGRALQIIKNSREGRKVNWPFYQRSYCWIYRNQYQYQYTGDYNGYLQIDIDCVTGQITRFVEGNYSGG